MNEEAASMMLKEVFLPEGKKLYWILVKDLLITDKNNNVITNKEGKKLDFVKTVRVMKAANKDEAKQEAFEDIFETHLGPNSKANFTTGAIYIFEHGIEPIKIMKSHGDGKDFLVLFDTKKEKIIDMIYEEVG